MFRDHTTVSDGKESRYRLPKKCWLGSSSGPSSEGRNEGLVSDTSAERLGNGAAQQVEELESQVLHS